MKIRIHTETGGAEIPAPPVFQSVFYTEKVFSVEESSFMEEALMNRISPMVKVTISTPMPLLTLPVSWLTMPISVVPRKQGVS